jgi:hypothetical protein
VWRFFSGYVFGGSQDLMLSIKHLAMVRVKSTREKALNGLLTPAGLRAIGRSLRQDSKP